MLTFYCQSAAFLCERAAEIFPTGSSCCSANQAGGAPGMHTQAWIIAIGLRPRAYRRTTGGLSISFAEIVAETQAMESP